MFPSMNSNFKIRNSKINNVNIDKIKQKFFNFFEEQEFEKREPLPLISEYFPSSFVISAGPDLGDEYYNLAYNKKRFMLLQPCARYWDVKDSGDGRHLSLFEMSAINDFGFKGRTRIIKLFLDFFTIELGISLDNLCATYFEGGTVAKKYYQKEDIEFKQIISEVAPTLNIYKVDAHEGFVANSMEPFGGEKVEFYHIDHDIKCMDKCGSSPDKCICGKYLEICTVITYNYIVEHSKDKRILELKQIDLDREDIISVIGFGVERVASIVDNKRYMLNELNPFFKILANKKFNLRYDDFNKIDLIRALIFLISSMTDKLKGKKHKERRWCFNKYRNKELLIFINEDKERTKKIIEIIIDNHKEDNYLFKDADEILDTIINWR